MNVVPVTFLGAAVLLGIGITAKPVWAHEEITPATVPTGKPTFLTLSAANEEGANLVRVTLRPAAGVSFGVATQQPPGWVAERSPTAITWSGGQVEPGSFAEWGFEIEAVGQPGPLRFSVEKGFADGSTSDSQVEIVAEGVPVVTAPPTTAAPATAPPTEAPVGMDHSNSDTDSTDGRATLALVVGAVAAVLSLLAVVLTLADRRRPPGALSPTSTPEQDW